MSFLPRSVDTLDQLIKTRVHGAVNIAGIRFQLLYSLLRSFDLYEPDSSTTVQFEGLEDLDKRILRAGDTYYQVKTSTSVQGWGWFNEAKILDHFLEVYRLDPTAKFVVVTNFRLKGDLEKLAVFCQSRTTAIPPTLHTKLKKLANRQHTTLTDLTALLHQTTFEYIVESEIHQALTSAVIHHFAIDTGNEQLYLSRLFHCVVDWTAQRAVISRQHLEIEKLSVQDAIGLGKASPALRNRLIEPVTLQDESNVQDYYEGKQAQLRHILAQLDAPRPKWQQAIHDAFTAANVCIIRSSSGQGKSTLIYRFAHDNFVPGTIYRLNTCSQDEEVGQIINYLRSRLSLGLPLVVLIDNLDFSQRLWHQLAAALSGTAIRFLVSVRTEDWYRYGIQISGFSYKIVEPTLDLVEAREIFQHFQQEHKIASTVQSAEWAYEKVAERGLLIEFVYLITHGHMLTERIEAQIRMIEDQREDPAKLDILRLVSVAQCFGARISLDTLLELVRFSGDPERTLRSMDGEYLTVRNKACEGLHLVRSEHLVRSLHGLLPIEQTLQRLLRHLDLENLTALVSQVFADQSLDADALIAVLIDRCRYMALPQINELLNALFLASESLYIQANQPTLDTIVKLSGPSSLLLVAAATMPSGEYNIYEQLAGLAAFDNNLRLQLQKMLVEEMKPREALGTQRVAKTLLQSLVRTLHFDETVALDECAQLADWCIFFQADLSALSDFYRGDVWEQRFWQHNSAQQSAFLISLHRVVTTRYLEFATKARNQLLTQFKDSFDTLTIWGEDPQTIHIEFIVNELDQQDKPHEQALWRLRHLRQWFPTYALYCSQGLYPSNGATPPEIDDTKKRMAAEALDQEIFRKQNRQYIRLLDAHYAKDTFYEWATHWIQLRSKVLALVQELVTLHDSTYVGKSYNTDILQKLYADFEQLNLGTPGLPALIEHALGQQAPTIQSKLRQWQSSIHAFLQQYLQFISGEEKERMTRLMRYNLRDAMEKLSEFQSSFITVLRVGPVLIENTVIDEHEQQAYHTLVDIFDLFYDEQTDRRHVPKARQLQTTLNLWRTQQESKFFVKLKHCLAPLAEAGVQFYYPTKRKQKGFLFDVYLAFEIMDFEQIALQMGYIAQYLAQLEAPHHFLYLVPTIDKHPLGNMIMVSVDTLKALADEKEPFGQIHPLPISEDALALVPELKKVPLADITLVHQIGATLAQCAFERNKLLFARSHLTTQDLSDHTRLTKFEEHFASRMQEVVTQGEAICQQASETTVGEEAQAAWNELWDEAVVLLHALADVTTVDESYVAQPMRQSMPVDPLFFRYLNHRYRRQQTAR